MIVFDCPSTGTSLTLQAATYARTHTHIHSLLTDNVWHRSTAEMRHLFEDSKRESRNATRPPHSLFSSCKDSTHQFHRLTRNTPFTAM